MKTNDSSHYSPFELESRGWKITRIDSKSVFDDFNVFHAYFFPFGHEIKNTTRGAALEFINNFLKEDQHKEELERFNLDR